MVPPQQLFLLSVEAADYDTGIGVGTNIPELVSAVANHEVAAMARLPSHGASTVRIHGIRPGEKGIQTPIRIDYEAATEVEGRARREAARAIECIQAHLVHCPKAAYGLWEGQQYAWLLGWFKARERVGVTAVEATQIIGLGAGQGDLHD